MKKDEWIPKMAGKLNGAPTTHLDRLLQSKPQSFLLCVLRRDKVFKSNSKQYCWTKIVASWSACKVMVWMRFQRIFGTFQLNSFSSNLQCLETFVANFSASVVPLVTLPQLHPPHAAFPFLFAAVATDCAAHLCPLSSKLPPSRTNEADGDAVRCLEHQASRQALAFT